MIVFGLCLLSFILGIIVGIVFGFYVVKKATEEILKKIKEAEAEVKRFLKSIEEDDLGGMIQANRKLRKIVSEWRREIEVLKKGGNLRILFGRNKRR